MSKLKAAFDAAVADSKTLASRPDNQTLLKIYALFKQGTDCLLYTSPSPRDRTRSRMPSSA